MAGVDRNCSGKGQTSACKHMDHSMYVSSVCTYHPPTFFTLMTVFVVTGTTLGSFVLSVAYLVYQRAQAFGLSFALLGFGREL